MKINEIQEEIIREMAGLDDWMDKYEYLIKLGKPVDPDSNDIISIENALQGCGSSSVWISAESTEDGMLYRAHSDSVITRGILALLLRVVNHQDPREIRDADFFFLKRTGLSTNLSPVRANGLGLMVRRLQSTAEEFC